MDMKPVFLSENLQALRCTKGKSANEINKELNLRHSKRLAELETGREPKFDELLLLAQYYKVSLEDLVHNQIKVTFKVEVNR